MYSIIHDDGFTLIELVVVFTVIAILSTIGTVSLVSYSRAQVLSQTTSDLVQTLNTAKSLSASQLKTIDKNGSGPKGCLDTQTLNGYGVQIVNNANPKYYELYIQCINSNGQPAQISTDLKWQTPLPDGVSFDAATNITDIFFPILSGGTVTKGSGNADSIVLSSYGNTKIINLKQGYISISP